MKLTVEQNKKLIETYPFLQPRNVWTDRIPDNFDFTHVRGDEYEIPVGWSRLFLLYCKSIRPFLAADNCLHSFRFTQIKEKYGKLRIYNTGCPETVFTLTMLYEAFSLYVCEHCGNWAKYRTEGWISSLCNKCAKDSVYKLNRIWRRNTLRVITTKSNKQTVKKYSIRDISKEYKKCMKMTDDEFFNYVTSVHLTIFNLDS